MRAHAVSRLDYAPGTPMPLLFAFIALNNFLPSLVLGPVLIKLFYPMLKKSKLIYGA